MCEWLEEKIMWLAECNFRLYKKITITFARTSFVRYFGVSICFSKHLKGFILVFLLLVLWFLYLWKLLLAVFYPMVYVHTLEQPMFGISFWHLKKYSCYGVLREFLREMYQKGIFLGYFYFRESWKAGTWSFPSTEAAFREDLSKFKWSFSTLTIQKSEDATVNFFDSVRQLIFTVLL